MLDWATLLHGRCAGSNRKSTVRLERHVDVIRDLDHPICRNRDVAPFIRARSDVVRNSQTDHQRLILGGSDLHAKSVSASGGRI